MLVHRRQALCHTPREASGATTPHAVQAGPGSEEKVQASLSASDGRRPLMTEARPQATGGQEAGSGALVAEGATDPRDDGELHAIVGHRKAARRPPAVTFSDLEIDPYAAVIREPRAPEILLREDPDRTDSFGLRLRLAEDQILRVGDVVDKGARRPMRWSLKFRAPEIGQRCRSGRLRIRDKGALGRALEESERPLESVVDSQGSNLAFGGPLIEVTKNHSSPRRMCVRQPLEATEPGKVILPRPPVRHSCRDMRVFPRDADANDPNLADGRFRNAGHQPPAR